MMGERNTSTEAKLTKILAQEPKYIFIKDKSSFFIEASKLLFEKTLKAHYQIVKVIENRRIYRRI